MPRLHLAARASYEGPEGVRSLTERQAALLAYLVGEGATSRARLAALLWPDTDGARARGNLRQLLHRLGPLRAALTGDDPLAVAEGLEVVYRGDPEALLTGYDFAGCDALQRWLDAARERRHRALLDDALVRLERAEAAGDADALRRHAEAVLELDPYAEQRVRRLVTLLLRSGDAAAARRLYARARERIAEAMDLDPEAVLPEIAPLLERGLAGGVEALVGEGRGLLGPDREEALALLDASRRAWQAAWGRAVELGDAELLAAAAEPLALYFEHRQLAYEGLRLLTSAVTALEVRDDPAARRALGRSLVHAAWLRHRLGLAARETAASGVEALRRVDDHRHLAQGLYALGVAYWYAGDTAAAQRAWQEAEGWVQRIADPTQLKHLHGNLAMAADALGDLDRALHHYRAALDLHRAAGEMGSTVAYLNNLGDLLVRLGRGAEAEAPLHEGLALTRALDGQRYLRPYLLDGLAHAALAQGRLDEARSLLDEAEGLVRAAREGRYLAIDLGITRLRLAAAAGEGGAADAVALLAEAWELGYRPAVLTILMLLAHSLLAAGAPDGAYPILATLRREGDADRRTEAARLLTGVEAPDPVLPIDRLVPALLGGG